MRFGREHLKLKSNGRRGASGGARAAREAARGRARARREAPPRAHRVSDCARREGTRASKQETDNRYSCRRVSKMDRPSTCTITFLRSPLENEIKSNTIRVVSRTGRDLNHVAGGNPVCPREGERSPVRCQHAGFGVRILFTALISQPDLVDCARQTPTETPTQQTPKQ